MGLFDTLFGNKKPLGKTRGYFKMLDGYTPVYTNFNGGMYEMLQTKAVINTIATDCGKAVAELQKHNQRYEYILKHRPNPLMNASDFIERVATSYFCDNNAFIVPITDKYDRVVGLFPIHQDACEALDVNGELYIRYTFGNGQKGAIEYSRVGHLKRMQYKSDLFGSNNNAMNQTMNILHSQNESVENALKNSGSIRFMGKIREQLLDKEAFEEQRNLFKAVNFSSDNGQMMIYDSRFEDIKQIESKPVYLDDKQKALIDENIRDYFGVSPKVVQHNFSSDYEWASYYEGVIEPFLIKLSEEITKILYTESQVMNANGVYYTTNRLQYMTNQSKLEFSSQMFDRGIISGNQVADVWNLAHYDGGDKHYIRREYADIMELNREDLEEQGEIQDENSSGQD